MDFICSEHMLSSLKICLFGYPVLLNCTLLNFQNIINLLYHFNIFQCGYCFFQAPIIKSWRFLFFCTVLRLAKGMQALGFRLDLIGCACDRIGLVQGKTKGITYNNI